jgi:hypothetical protein
VAYEEGKDVFLDLTLHQTLGEKLSTSNFPMKNQWILALKKNKICQIFSNNLQTKFHWLEGIVETNQEFLKYFLTYGRAANILRKTLSQVKN